MRYLAFWALALAMSGCAGSDPSSDPGQQPAADAPTETAAQGEGSADDASGDVNVADHLEEVSSDVVQDVLAQEAEAEAPCGECLFAPGDVVGLLEDRHPTPALGTDEYLAMAAACPVVVIDRILPPDGVGFNHTIIITEGGTWQQARFVHATDPGGVFETSLKDWIETRQTACGWQFLEGEVYRRPAGYVVSAEQAVKNVRSYIGETYAITPDMVKPETWAHFRDDPNAKLEDILKFESLETSLGLLGEISWDFAAFGVTQMLYSQPRYCGLTKAGTQSCGPRQCNQWPAPGKGTKYCSELAWWAYAGFEGTNAAGDRPAGKNGEVPDLYEHKSSVMTSISHTSNDLVLNFEIKCKRAPFKQLKDVSASCP
jgi:hypothetical protein